MWDDRVIRDVCWKPMLLEVEYGNRYCGRAHGHVFTLI